MFKDIKERLKSPVVAIQLVSIIGSAVVLLLPNASATVEGIVTAATVIINVIAGLNNPTDKSHF